MDRTLRPTWTDQDETVGRLEFIPAPEREQGYRSHPRLEINATEGVFNIHPALRRAIYNPGPMVLEDDLASRLNNIKLNESEKGTLDKVSTRDLRLLAFKSLVPQPAPTPPPAQDDQPPRESTLSAAFWKSFWKREMPHNVRNVWWRLLIRKLPTGVRLHAFIPMIVSPQCRVCQERETDQHLLFGCPAKLEIWKASLNKYIREYDWTVTLIESLFYPVPPKFEALNNLPVYLLLGTIMATIWRYHHKSIREDEPFDSRRVSAAVDLAIGLVTAQLEEKRKSADRARHPSASSQQQFSDIAPFFTLLPLYHMCTDFVDHGQLYSTFDIACLLSQSIVVCVC
jgi:hypothetical protein